ncbi:MAG: alginate lyase family protein, partial [Leifsonia sp.]
TLSDLTTLKAYVDQGKQPWKSGYNQLANSPESRLSYAGRGGPFAKVSRAPDVNLNAWRTDMVAIWDLSRMWYFTKNAQYAVNARKLLLGWATTQTEFSGRESMLDLGDYASQFVGGAEILRSTYPGWTEADTATVKKYFKDVLTPAANPYGSMFGAANKGALALTALGLMAIYDDDVETLNSVVYQVRTRANIGLRNSNDIGMLGDYLRDQGHSYGQLKSLTMLAEALWTQGIDIYSDFDNRLLAAGEYFARVNELVPTTALPFGTTDRYYTSDVTNRGWAGANGGSVALTQLYDAYVLREGLQAPFIAQRLHRFPVDGDSFMFLKESDTSTAMPPPALPIPSTTSITSGFSNIELGGAPPAGMATYANGKWMVQGAGNDLFWGAQDASHFTYKAITGNSAIIAKVESVQNTNPAALAGVMMRTSLETGAPRAWMAVASRGNAEQSMPNLAVYGGTNYGTKPLPIASSTPSYWVKLERIGNIITGYISPDGTNWAATDVGRINDPVPDTIYVGLVVASAAWGTQNSSVFSNVQITGGDGGAPSVIPAAPAMLLASPGDGAVPLRWQASFGATGYTIRRSKLSGGPSETIASGVTGSSYTDKSVTNGTTYYYTVTATNSAGTSGTSPVDSATPFHPTDR